MPAMFLRAGAISLALLLASRLLGLLRESAQAAAFGATGLGDVAVLMLALPDWLAGVLASGALAYVLLPAWSRQAPAQQAASQRRVAHALVLLGCVLALWLGLDPDGAVAALAPGLPPDLHADGIRAVIWSAAALPLALLAALWVTRLQHERDFTGLYAANLVVNTVLIATLATLAWQGLRDPAAAVLGLGIGLVAAMLARLAWLLWRQRHLRPIAPQRQGSELPRPSVWLWAAAAAGLPLALPFAARSLASQEGEGALATFNYAWKLVELPLVLAVQLVATLALGPIATALGRPGAQAEAAPVVRRGFALAWVLACACAAGVVVAAPALAQLLFGWGRMQPQALEQVAAWGRIGAWSLLPQALLAIALAVLAAQSRMRVAVVAHAVALGLLLAGGAARGGELMLWLDLLWTGVCAAVLASLGPALRSWLPWPALLAGGATLLAVQGLVRVAGLPAAAPLQLAAGAAAAAAVLVLAWVASADLRGALRR